VIQIVVIPISFVEVLSWCIIFLIFIAALQHLSNGLHEGSDFGKSQLIILPAIFYSTRCCKMHYHVISKNQKEPNRYEKGYLGLRRTRFLCRPSFSNEPLCLIILEDIYPNEILYYTFAGKRLERKDEEIILVFEACT